MSVLLRNSCMSPEQADRAFYLSSRYIEREVANRTVQARRFWVDMFPITNFPDGIGLTMDKVRFYGDIGPQYDGFDGWRALELSRKPGESMLGEHNACGFSPDTVGHGMETVSFNLMERDLATKPICIKDVRTTYLFKEFQGMIFQNLANITMNIREQLNRNAAHGFAVKHVAIPGLPTNHADPYKEPLIPTGTKVGKLTHRLLKSLYPWLAQQAGNYAITTLRGMPAFGVVCHPETWEQMVYEDDKLRFDISQSSMADDLVKKYAFIDAMGQFINMPDYEAPRFNVDSNGRLQRVLPWVRNVNIEVGTRPMPNADYQKARFERVLIMTKGLFKLRTRSAITSAGGGTKFEGDPGLFQWKWWNPPGQPFQRVGQYVATGELGIEPGDFTDTISLLVERASGDMFISYWGDPVAAPDLPDPITPLVQACVCPKIVSISKSWALTEALIDLDIALNAAVSQKITFALVNGGSFTATVTQIDTSKTRVLITSDADTIAKLLADPYAVEGIQCSTQTWCDSEVDGCNDCRSSVANSAILRVARPLRLTGPTFDDVKVYFRDGTTAQMDVVAYDSGAGNLTVRMNGESDSGTGTYDLCCARKGVLRVCVLPTEGNGCPGCDAPTGEAPCSATNVCDYAWTGTALSVTGVIAGSGALALGGSAPFDKTEAAAFKAALEAALPGATATVTVNGTHILSVTVVGSANPLLTLAFDSTTAAFVQTNCRAITAPAS